MSVAPEDNFDLFPQEEWYEELLRYGLYIGAAFQLIAILAIIAFPPSSSDHSEESPSAAVSIFFFLLVSNVITNYAITMTITSPWNSRDHGCLQRHLSRTVGSIRGNSEYPTI
jgi:hypothetical protein